MGAELLCSSMMNLKRIYEVAQWPIGGSEVCLVIPGVDILDIIFCVWSV